MAKLPITVWSALAFLIVPAAVYLRATLPGGQMLSFEDIKKLPLSLADRRIAYGPAPQEFGDLRLPHHSGPHPTAIIIHGGCWLSEYNLNYIASFSEALARAGVATWSLEYRRVGDPGGGWPGTCEDVARGADYLRVLAPEFDLDLSRDHRSRTLGGRPPRAVVGGSPAAASGERPFHG